MPRCSVCPSRGADAEFGQWRLNRGIGERRILNAIARQRSVVDRCATASTAAMRSSPVNGRIRSVGRLLAAARSHSRMTRIPGLYRCSRSVITPELPSDRRCSITSTSKGTVRNEASTACPLWAATLTENPADARTLAATACRSRSSRTRSTDGGRGQGFQWGSRETAMRRTRVDIAPARKRNLGTGRFYAEFLRLLTEMARGTYVSDR
jgi:hypothetical protein